MVAKAKPAVEEPDVKEPETDAEKPVTKSDVVEIVKDALKDVLPGKSAEEESTEEPEKETGKPMTAREEEARTHSIVSEAIKAFKEEFSGDDAKKEKKKEPEAEPGKKPTRWIERFVWGQE